MAIQVNCAGCGRQFRAKDQFRDTRLKCPGCKSEVIVRGPHVCGSDVFISHSSHDKQVADAVCAALESKNLNCWVAPRDIPPGASWGSAIIEGIEDSRSMLLVFSGHANKSDQVLREVERAVAKHKPVVPLRIDREPMRKDFEYFLASCHWLDVTEGGLEEHLAGLTTKMRHLLLDRAEAERTEEKATVAETAVPPGAVGESAKGKATAPASRRTRSVLGLVVFVGIACAVFYATRQGASDSKSINPADKQPANLASASHRLDPAAIDLLARFRIPEDVVSGEWTRTADGVHVAGQAPGRANFGEPPAGDYDVRVEFTPLIGEQGIGLVLSRFGQNFAFGLGAESAQIFGFGLERGKAARRQTVTSIGPLQNNRRYTVVVQVRRHGAVAMINGQRVAQLFTADFRELSLPRQWGIGKNSLGLVTYRTVLIHSAQCVKVADADDTAPAPATAP